MGKKSKDPEAELGLEEASESVEPAAVSASYEERIKLLNPIAKPLAGKKLTKKIYKLIKKASKDKKFCFDGLRQVQYKLRKGETGLVIFAGDVYPVDIYSHLPGVCEDADLPYCFVPSKKDIGLAMGVNRPVTAVILKEKSDYAELFQEVMGEVKLLPIPW